MSKKKKRTPCTPGQRFYVPNEEKVSTKNVPERRLTESKHRKKGRNAYGRITSRRRGGGHKKLYRKIDFKRDKLNIPAKIQSIEYDPFRSANIALVAYRDGEKRYILAPQGMNVGDSIINVDQPVEEYNVGISMPLKHIPPTTTIHAIEMQPGRGAQIARGAGVSAVLIAIEKGNAIIKMPSNEQRLINANCRATIGEIGNKPHGKMKKGKAGRNRWLGRRPRVRGVAMNPVDHPMGGGEGKASGGQPVSPWSQLAKGFPTRKKRKPSNRMILIRRNGRKVKRV